MRIDRDLVAASATPLVLAILAEEEAPYGYAILKRIRELSDGNIEWTDGMLYPLLHRLERLEQVKSSWQTSNEGRRRKHYTITETGRQALADRQSQWAVVNDALDRVWTPQDRRRPMPKTVTP